MAVLDAEWIERWDRAIADETARHISVCIGCDWCREIAETEKAKPGSAKIGKKSEGACSS